MARGHHWEATYDLTWDGPVQTFELSAVVAGDEISDRRLVAIPSNAAVTVRWRRSDETRLFVRCDFQLGVSAESYITNCEFRLCRFNGSVWDGVRFSNCRFEHCDFSEMTLRKCYFVNNCTFVANTASPQKFRIEETAISASAFIAGLAPNLEFESHEKINYSKFKFTATRQKIAKAIFSANRNEADVDYYFEAFEQLTRCTLAERVERYAYIDETPQKIARPLFWKRSFAARVDRRVVLLSGWLTQWGRSVSRPLCVFAATIATFTFIYALISIGSGFSLINQLQRSFATAVNITLVVGYTAEFRHDLPRLLKAAMMLNVVIGLLWYSLIIPALTRRILR